MLRGTIQLFPSNQTLACHRLNNPMARSEAVAMAGLHNQIIFVGRGLIFNRCMKFQ